IGRQRLSDSLRYARRNGTAGSETAGRNKRQPVAYQRHYSPASKWNYSDHVSQRRTISHKGKNEKPFADTAAFSNLWSRESESADWLSDRSRRWYGASNGTDRSKGPESQNGD